MTEAHPRSAEAFLAGLRELAESAFPKKCPSCGRVFESAEVFLKETRAVRPDHSGVKPTRDDDGTAVLEVYRNCPCGSTLMDFFSERRDRSERGLERRRRFAELLDYLVAQGVDAETARAELKKVLRGERSEMLAKIRPPASNAPSSSPIDNGPALGGTRGPR